jgi:hypothetical protein
MAHHDKSCVILKNHRPLGYERVEERNFNEVEDRDKLQNTRRNCSDTLILA